MRAQPRVLVGVSVLWIPLAFLFDGVTLLVLPVRLGDRPDATTLGLVSFAGLAVGVAIQPLAGALGDRLRTRVDRRVFLLATAPPVLAGIWLVVGTTGALAVVAGYVVMQAAAGAMQGGLGALIPEHIPPEVRGRASGLKSAFDVGGAFAGFIILGALVASGDIAAVGPMLTVIVLIGCALVWVLVPPVDPAPSAHVPEPTGPAWPTGFMAVIVSRFLFLFGTYAVGDSCCFSLGSAWRSRPSERPTKRAGCSRCSRPRRRSQRFPLAGSPTATVDAA